MKRYKQIRSLKIILPFLIIISFIAGCSYFQSAAKGNEAFDPEASLKKANDLIQNRNFEEARQILEDIKAKDASQQYATLARLRIADTYFENESFDEAATEYSAFIESDAYNKYASYAQYRLAMSFFKQIKTVDISYSTAQKALSEFEKLRENYPRNPYMDVTEERIKECRRMLAEHEFYVGSFYFNKGSYEAAAQRFNALLSNYPGSVIEPETLYYLGLSYKALGQTGQALKTLKTLTDKFPSLELSNQAKKQLASLTYLIIRNNDK